MRSCALRTLVLFEDSNDPAVFGFRLLADPGKSISSVRVDRQASTSVLLPMDAFESADVAPRD